MTMCFGARLRLHRERRGIGLDAIARSTKIGLPILEAIERDDASRLPSGIFRRAFIRAYATAIGLDPESTLSEFLERFPDPSDADRSNPLVASSGGAGEALRLMLADETRSSYGFVLRATWLRIRAAVCDLVTTIALAVGLSAIAGQFWTCFTVATVGYYVAGALLVGSSPAASVIGRRRRTHVAPPPAKAIELSQEPEPEPDHLAVFSPRRYPTSA